MPKTIGCPDATATQLANSAKVLVINFSQRARIAALPRGTSGFGWLEARPRCRPVPRRSAQLPRGSRTNAEEEDARRLHRERQRLMRERTGHLNRIKALLITHGIRALRTTDAKWCERLDKMRTGVGRVRRNAYAPCPQRDASPTIGIRTISSLVAMTEDSRRTSRRNPENRPRRPNRACRPVSWMTSFVGTINLRSQSRGRASCAHRRRAWRPRCSQSHPMPATPPLAQYRSAHRSVCMGRAS
jgi:hypothetical protein